MAMATVCVGVGWLHTHGFKARIWVFWTQALHWLAFLSMMNMIVLSDVQVLLGPMTGKALLILLALGTFVAGLHISWEICVLGLVMAFCLFWP
jgi:hypothetical protein